MSNTFDKNELLLGAYPSNHLSSSAHKIIHHKCSSMIIRLVKMTFNQEDVEPFLAELDKRKERIRNFDGCSFLEIFRDRKDPRIVFSHSYWESEDALNNYRYSDFFQETWTFTKAKFAAKPEAWTVDCLHRLP